MACEDGEGCCSGGGCGCCGVSTGKHLDDRDVVGVLDDGATDLSGKKWDCGDVTCMIGDAGGGVGSIVGTGRGEGCDVVMVGLG